MNSPTITLVILLLLVFSIGILMTDEFDSWMKKLKSKVLRSNRFQKLIDEVLHPMTSKSMTSLDKQCEQFTYLKYFTSLPKRGLPIHPITKNPILDIDKCEMQEALTLGMVDDTLTIDVDNLHYTQPNPLHGARKFKSIYLINPRRVRAMVMASKSTFGTDYDHQTTSRPKRMSPDARTNAYSPYNPKPLADLAMFNTQREFKAMDSAQMTKLHLVFDEKSTLNLSEMEIDSIDISSFGGKALIIENKTGSRLTISITNSHIRGHIRLIGEVRLEVNSSKISNSTILCEGSAHSSVVFKKSFTHHVRMGSILEVISHDSDHYLPSFRSIVLGGDNHISIPITNDNMFKMLASNRYSETYLYSHHSNTRHLVMGSHHKHYSAYPEYTSRLINDYRLNTPSAKILKFLNVEDLSPTLEILAKMHSEWSQRHIQEKIQRYIEVTDEEERQSLTSYRTFESYKEELNSEAQSLLIDLIQTQE